ncbi:hypothetical protein ILYODFUR_005638 [Ilyodon furcidens]|uniref:Uncharacterized protein n=1 Tax=Ilyodon furcidens TaxID=33524 RepID=A0ABV0SJG0_9TELE
MNHLGSVYPYPPVHLPHPPPTAHVYPDCEAFSNMAEEEMELDKNGGEGRSKRARDRKDYGGRGSWDCDVDDCDCNDHDTEDIGERQSIATQLAKGGPRRALSLPGVLLAWGGAPGAQGHGERGRAVGRCPFHQYIPSRSSSLCDVKLIQ